MDFISIKNNQCIRFGEIPVLPYADFYSLIDNKLTTAPDAHCVAYYGVPMDGKIRLICCLADDATHLIDVASAVVEPTAVLESLTPKHLDLQLFEREIHENFGIGFSGHPWLKPVRYPHNAADRSLKMQDYPFYQIDSEELHEVGVGPIHAGIIEPGHFRFICNGEQILHLEIQLGYQHRGIETLFLQKNNLLQRATLAENIAGDTVIGHSTAFANLWESLCGFEPSRQLQIERAFALENERIAIHTGDLSGICTDIAYQLGNSVFGRLRTPVINYFQRWAGNRFAKGLIRPGKTNFHFTKELAQQWIEMISAYQPDFVEMANQTFDLPSVLSRIERTGIVEPDTARKIGMVGMAARASNVPRDVRSSHPWGYYNEIQYQPVTEPVGDVYCRARIRHDEILKSIDLMKQMIDTMDYTAQPSATLANAAADSFVVSLVEGWRGEICHCAITDANGELKHYKIKDPSFHNWLGLALAVRNNEISDFPICNKSFDLSYSGHDL
ncbi:MAG: NADH-quinone oxidoreductase subunit C [Salinivirgaceae bacterium]|nr:NADH-quinone oxidoreductase subunit C [Salinivirgaceae bacterium]